MTGHRQPVELERVGGKTPRDVMWAEIRRQRTFTLKSLSQRIRGSTESAIRSYLTCLCAGDYLIPISNSEPITYTLARDCGVDAPRIRKDGTAVMQGRGNDNMWRTMKILKTFSWQDVALASSTDTVAVTAKTARAYVETLCKAGYLLCVSQGSAGVKAIYRISPSKCVGAKAPQIQRGGSLYDPNLGRVVYQPIAKTCEGLAKEACHE